MKPIFISEEERKKLIEEFAASLSTGLYDGEVKFSKSYIYKEKDHPKAKIYYTAEAFAKTISLIQKFESEVAWHGLIKRGQQPNEFIVYDIIVYPQRVTGATVNTDDEGYAEFLIGLTDEEAEDMHIQCHSHVNMGTTPSSTDKTHQEGVLKMMNNQGFYVFQIWNKRMETTNFIYDFDHNVMYESKDIEWEVLDDTWGTVNDFIADAKKIVKATYTAPVSTGGYYPKPAANPTYSWTPGVNNSKAASNWNDPSKEKKKEEKAKDWVSDLDEDDDIDYAGVGAYRWGSNYYSSGY